MFNLFFIINIKESFNIAAYIYRRFFSISNCTWTFSFICFLTNWCCLTFIIIWWSLNLNTMWSVDITKVYYKFIQPFWSFITLRLMKVMICHLNWSFMQIHRTIRFNRFFWKASFRGISDFAWVTRISLGKTNINLKLTQYAFFYYNWVVF